MVVIVLAVYFLATMIQNELVMEFFLHTNADAGCSGALLAYLAPYNR